MTLFRQIAIAMSVLVVSLLAVTMYTNYQTTIRFIEGQLYTNAKNTASSLGLAISKSSEGRDTVMAETMINAVFDSGLYEAIVYTDIDGKLLYQRRIPMTLDGAPEWFAEAVGVPPVKVSVPVGREWMLVGNLQVEGHRGYAYTQMWEIFKKVLVSFLVLSVLALAGIYFLLKVVLLSLQKVREQAEAVAGNRFIIQDTLPHTTEFREVVRAMNSLVAKVKVIYKQEAEAIARYNAMLYEDRQTHLKNRDFFLMKLKSLLAAEDRFSEGFVIILQLKDTEAVKFRDGISALQKQLAHAADAARVIVNKAGEGFACRVREFDIILLLPALKETEAKAYADEMLKDCTRGDCIVHIAAVGYHAGQSASEVLSHIDYALMQATADKKCEPVFYRSERTDIPAWGHDEWRKQLLQAMEEDRFLLYYQDVMDRGTGTVQKELLLRLKIGDTILNAGVFIPVIANLALENTLDRYVLERAAQTYHSTEIAVNVSSDFIRQSSTFGWLSGMQSSWKLAGVRLAFELPNTEVLADMETAETFSQFVHKMGYRFGIDHFAIEDGDLHYLQKVKPSYLKIDAAYLLSLIETEEETKRSSSFFTVTRILDIDLIAIGVDSEATAERLYAQGIEMVQGFWVGQPHEETA